MHVDQVARAFCSIQFHTVLTANNLNWAIVSYDRIFLSMNKRH